VRDEQAPHQSRQLFVGQNHVPPEPSGQAAEAKREPGRRVHDARPGAHGPGDEADEFSERVRLRPGRVECLAVPGSDCERRRILDRDGLHPVVAAPWNGEDRRMPQQPRDVVHEDVYWVRFQHGEVTFARAAANTRLLLAAARQARVRRFVHISVTHASRSSPLPYFHWKGVLEGDVAASGLPFAIVRPTLIFGSE